MLPTKKSMKSILIKTAHYFWITVAVLIVLLAVLIQLARELSPQLNKNKDYLAGLLANALNSRVEIGEVRANWQGLSATIQVRDLSIRPLLSQSLPSQDLSQIKTSPSLSVGQASIKVDWLRTLASMRLSFADITLTDTHAYLEQSEEGVWNLAGIETSPQGASASFDDPMDVFLFADNVLVNDVRVFLKNSYGRAFEFDVTSITFENQDLFHRIKANFTHAGQQAVEFVMEANGDPRAKGNRDLKAFLSITELPIKSLQNLLLASGWNIKGDDDLENHLNGKIWLSSSQLGSYQLNGQLGLSLGQTNIENKLTLPRAISARFFGSVSQFPSDFGLTLQVNDLSVGWQDLKLSPINVQIEHVKEDWLVQVDDIDLAETKSAISALAIDNALLNSAVNSLDPEGNVSQIKVTVPQSAPSEFFMDARVTDVSVSGWRGIPGLSSVDGFVHVAANDGYVLLDDQNSFVAQFDQILSGPLEYTNVEGSVSWHLRPDQNAIYVLSNKLRLTDGQSLAKAQFRLYTPWIGGSAPTDLNLVVGMQNAEAEDRHPYIPLALEDNLKQWLVEGIKQGKVPEAGLVMRGRFSGHKTESVAQLWLNINDAAVQYHEDWPAVESLNGQLIVNNGEARAHVDSATMWNSDIHATDVLIESNVGQVVLRLDGRATGPGDDGLRFLRESPIKNAVGETFDEWHLAGDYQASVSLSTQLAGNVDFNEYQHVNIQITPGLLTLGELDLELEGVTGDLIYDSEEGIVSKGISANLWGHPLKAQITSPISEYSQGEASARDMRLSFQSKVELTRLQDWLQSPELSFVQGTTLISGNLIVPKIISAQNSPGKTDSGLPNAELVLESDLVGVAINLPEPLIKDRDKSLPLRITMPIYDDYSEIKISLSDQHHINMHLHNGSVTAVGVGINSQPKLVANKVLVSGVVEFLELDPWLQVIEDYEEFSAAYEQEETGLHTEFDLSIGKVLVQDVAVTDIQLSGKQIADSWELSIASPSAQGIITIPEEEFKPIIANFDFLRIPADDQGQESGNIESDKDPLAGFDFSIIPSLDFKADEILYGGEDYGRWQFTLRPVTDGLVISNLMGDIRGLGIQGLGGEIGSGAELTWLNENGSAKTYFSGRLHAEQLHQVTERWQQPEFMRASDARFDVDLSWPGSPAAVSYLNLDGKIDIDIEHGRFKRGVEGGGNAFLRLVALFNFDSWARRLRLGASDLIDSGLTFDRIDGSIIFKDQKILMPEPILVKAPSSSLQYAGIIDLSAEELDTKLVATLPVGGNLTIIAAFAAGLPAAAGIWAASKLFKKQVSQVASVSYQISGKWGDPDLKFERLFDDNAKDKKRAKTIEDTIEGKIEAVEGGRAIESLQDTDQ